MTTTERPREFKVLGTSPMRQDAVDKVTGKSVYAADVRLVGTLQAAVLRSPHAHARIKAIDASAALKLPGVRAVATAHDFPPLDATAPVGMLGVGFLSMRDARDRVFASNKALYKGHAIAAVAADSLHIAEEALSRIKVDYEILPAVMDVHQAMKPDAPALHDRIELARGTMQQSGPNTLYTHLSQGDIEQGFKDSDVIVERDFSTQTIHHGFIEPISATAEPHADGSLTVWATCQGAFFFRDQICKILQIPEYKVRVVPTEVGGAFGGKEIAFLEPIAVVLALKAGHPVRVTMSRADVFQGSGPACGTYIKLKLGAKRDGTLTAAQAMLAYEAGAFPGAPVAQASNLIFGRYEIPHQSIDAYDVLVNKPKTQSYRAPGATQCHFAAETVIDELAEKLNLDPLEFRTHNAVKQGDRNIHGVPLPVIGATEVLEAVRNHPHYKAPLYPSGDVGGSFLPHSDGETQRGPLPRGRGIAMGLWSGTGMTSTASISVNADGSVNLITGSPDMSGTRLSLAMQAAEELGLPVELFKSTTGDTEGIGLTMPSWGSRVTFATGWATIEAAREVNQKLIGRVAQIWGTTPENVEARAGSFYNKLDPKQSFTFKQLAEKLGVTGGAVTATASIDPTRGSAPCMAACIVDVEVDPQTGKVQVLRCTVIQDVGRAVHYDSVVGQLQGGTVQAIGWALNEEYCFDTSGRMTNGTFLDYRMPVTLDIPNIDTVVIEVPNPGHPYGVRGAGEDSIVAPPAAIANAIYRAVGVRLNQLPMSPRVVLEALWRKQS